MSARELPQSVDAFLIAARAACRGGIADPIFAALDQFAGAVTLWRFGSSAARNRLAVDVPAFVEALRANGHDELAAQLEACSVDLD